MPRYNEFVGNCIHCNAPAYWNDEELWLKFEDDGFDCLHELETTEAQKTRSTNKHGWCREGK